MKLLVLPALLALCLPFATAKPCLSQSDVNTLTTHFGDLVSAYSQKLANQTLTVNFVDYSESIITLMDSAGTTPKALLGMAFTSRANFEAESSAQPSVPFQVQNTWYKLRYHHHSLVERPEPAASRGYQRAANGLSARTGKCDELQDQRGVGRVSGTVSLPSALFTLTMRFGIRFDSAAWLIDLGFTITPPSSKKREIAFEA
ncbi:hypothetical protein LTS09_012280 [Friedmanniomyces endolithicus]|nr:hypothetical protein LTS09_012280 [Friedmanniomyces endolithicus]